MKKKLLCTLLSVAMVASLTAGCGSNEGSNDATTDTNVGDTVADDTAEVPETSAPEWSGYDERIAAIRTEMDLEKREALMHEAEDELMATWAVVPLYFYNDVYLQKTDVEGIYSNAYGFKYFSYAKTPNNELALQVASEPDKLDPALNSSVDGACLAIAAFSGLYAYDENGQVVPELAEGYEMSEDGMTYTFTLRDGLKWSDGEVLDANDVVYSWNRLADPNTAADYSYLTDIIAKNDDGTLQISASEDGKTFTAQLTAPCAYFLDLCAFPAFYPVPEQSVTTADGADTNPGAWALEAGFVTSGPMKLVEWKHNESMTYEPNENYWAADRVSLTKMTFMLSADDAAIYSAFEDGSIQFADTIATDMMATVKGTPEYHQIDELGTYYCGFNVNSEIFDGLTVEQAANMRKAFSLLIDREYIVEAIGQANQQPANTFIPAGMADGNGGEFRQNDDAYTYPVEEETGYYTVAYSEEKVEEARELLKTCGYEFDDAGMLSADTPLDLVYLTNDSEGNVNIGEAMQQDFAVIGINMTVETREWSVFLNERKEGKFDFCREGWLADYNDPINMLEMWETESGNNDMQFGR